MSFIRVKKIFHKTTGKIYPYAYVVANSWTKKKVKQKVKKYLGRVYYFDRKEKSFNKFIDSEIEKYLDTRSADEIVLDVVRWELINHGFKREGKFLVNGDCYFDQGKKKICGKNGKDVSLAFNDGLLSTYLLRKLLRFNYKADEEEIMYKFAKDFVELGMKVPHEVFVSIFEKVF